MPIKTLGQLRQAFDAWMELPEAERYALKAARGQASFAWSDDDERKHPRAADGKWTAGESGAATDTPKPHETAKTPAPTSDTPPEFQLRTGNAPPKSVRTMTKEERDDWRSDVFARIGGNRKTLRYEDAVKAALEYMQTPGDDWAAVAISDVTETTSDTGKRVSMPVFDFPSGYEHAPAAFEGSTENPCCELCGHPIKRVYWIQNDKEQWTLAVGSECVTHFGSGESGEMLSGKAKAEANRDFIRQMHKARLDLFAKFARTRDDGMKVWPWNPGDPARVVYENLRKLLNVGQTNELRADEKPGTDQQKKYNKMVGIYQPSLDGTITRWVGKHGETARQLLDKVDELLGRDKAQREAMQEGAAKYSMREAVCQEFRRQAPQCLRYAIAEAPPLNPWTPEESAKHPRGQPENKGQFAPKGQGTTGSPADNGQGEPPKAEGGAAPQGRYTTQLLVDPQPIGPNSFSEPIRPPWKQDPGDPLFAHDLPPKTRKQAKERFYATVAPVWADLMQVRDLMSRAEQARNVGAHDAADTWEQKAERLARTIDANHGQRIEGALQDYLRFEGGQKKPAGTDYRQRLAVAEQMHRQVKARQAEAKRQASAEKKAREAAEKQQRAEARDAKRAQRQAEEAAKREKREKKADEARKRAEAQAASDRALAEIVARRRAEREARTPEEQAKIDAVIAARKQERAAAHREFLDNQAKEKTLAFADKINGVCQDLGIGRSELQAMATDLIRDRQDEIRQRETLLRHARQITGLDARKCRDWENNRGKDYSSWPGLDAAARSLAPEFAGTAGFGGGYDTETVNDTRDYGRELWDLIRNGAGRIPQWYDEDVLQQVRDIHDQAAYEKEQQQYTDDDTDWDAWGGVAPAADDRQPGDDEDIPEARPEELEEVPFSFARHPGGRKVATMDYAEKFYYDLCHAMGVEKIDYARKAGKGQQSFAWTEEDERKHPRAEDGKWTSGEAGGSRNDSQHAADKAPSEQPTHAKDNAGSDEERRFYEEYATKMKGFNLEPKPFEEWAANYRAVQARIKAQQAGPKPDEAPKAESPKAEPPKAEPPNALKADVKEPAAIEAEKPEQATPEAVKPIASTQELTQVMQAAINEVKQEAAAYDPSQDEAEDEGDTGEYALSPELPDAPDETSEERTKRAARNAVVKDFGEKIGGARKDYAVPTGPRPKKTQTDDRPGWARRYSIGQIASSMRESEVGKWAVHDERKKDWLGNAKLVGLFETREDAEKAIPLAEVSRGHGISYRTSKDAADPQAMEEYKKAFEKYVEDRKAWAAQRNKAFHEANWAKQRDQAAIEKQHAVLLMHGRAHRDTLSPEQQEEYRKVMAELAAINGRQPDLSEVGPEPQPPKEPENNGKEYFIYRKVSDRKRPLVKGGFKTEDDAKRYMAQHASEIIEYRLPRYETFQYLDHVERTGGKQRAKEVNEQDFQTTFAFRGGVFGNWQSDKSGQVALNHAYDALTDLADVLGLPPKALAMNGTLAMGFGAYGTGGKDSARAHYDPRLRLMNLTKMKGAGSLAHEWMHALDAYFGEQAHPDSNKYPTVTGGLRHGHQLRPEVADAFKHVIDTMMSKEAGTVEDHDQATASHKRTREFLATALTDLERRMEQARQYKKRAKPLTAEQQAEWNKAKDAILRGDVGKVMHIEPKGPGASKWNWRTTYEPLEKLNELYKKSTGHSFHTADKNSLGNDLYWKIKDSLLAEERIKSAEAGTVRKTRQQSEFLREARKLDNSRAKDYYATTEEMLSRAFEGYVADKLEAGRRSDYLIGRGKTDNRHYAAFDMKPFPEGEERTAINAALDKLFAAIRHESRTDQKGEHVRMYAMKSQSSALQHIVAETVNRLLYARKAASGQQSFNWDEESHPRDDAGKFTEKANAASAAADRQTQSLEHSGTPEAHKAAGQAQQEAAEAHGQAMEAHRALGNHAQADVHALRQRQAIETAGRHEAAARPDLPGQTNFLGEPTTPAAPELTEAAMTVRSFIRRMGNVQTPAQAEQVAAIEWGTNERARRAFPTKQAFAGAVGGEFQRMRDEKAQGSQTAARPIADRMTKQMQSMMFHGLKDAPGQQDLFNMDAVGGKTALDEIGDQFARATGLPTKATAASAKPTAPPTAYQKFIASGGKESEWEAYRQAKNAESSARHNTEFVHDWQSGKSMAGIDVANYLLANGVPLSETTKRVLSHQDTDVSQTVVSARGLSRPEAAKVHREVSHAMAQVTLQSIERQAATIGKLQDAIKAESLKGSLQPATEIEVAAVNANAAHMLPYERYVMAIRKAENAFDFPMNRTTKEMHRQQVQAAMDAGATIPPEVLAEYPEMKPAHRATSKTVADTTSPSRVADIGRWLAQRQSPEGDFLDSEGTRRGGDWFNQELKSLSDDDLHGAMAHIRQRGNPGMQRWHGGAVKGEMRRRGLNPDAVTSPAAANPSYDPEALAREAIETGKNIHTLLRERGIKDLKARQPALDAISRMRKEQAAKHPDSLAKRAAAGESVARPDGVSEARWNAMVKQMQHDLTTRADLQTTPTTVDQPQASKPIMLAGRGSRGFPDKLSASEIADRAKRALGRNFGGIYLAKYSGGYQVEVRKARGGIAAAYPIADNHVAAVREALGIKEAIPKTGKTLSELSPEEIAEITGRPARQQEPRATQTAARLNAGDQETFDGYRPILEKNMASTENPRKQAMEAKYLIEGLAPGAQKALADHLRTIAPEAYEELRKNPGTRMHRGIFA